jgi:hypothetical protein
MNFKEQRARLDMIKQLEGHITAHIKRTETAITLTDGLIKQRNKHPRNSAEYRLYGMLAEHADWTSEEMHKEIGELISRASFATEKLTKDLAS